MCEVNSVVNVSVRFSGIEAVFRTIFGNKGVMNAYEVRSRPGGGGYIESRARLLVLENSMVIVNGIALTPEYILSISNLAHSAGTSVYLDGARVFNAAVARGVDVKQLCAPVDALMVCLSKGLGAPIGSMLVGPVDFISEARRIRNVVERK